ncbi:MAG TPA: hypothetical protein VGA11_05175 [Acidimicrobiia bacterium]
MSASSSFAAANHFSVVGPAAVNAGTSFNVTVVAQDGGNSTDMGFVGVTTITSSDGAAVLPSPNPYTYTAGDSGSHTFAITLTTLGSRTVTFTAGSVTGTATINVVAPATHFSVVAPASALAGTPFQYTVTALTAGATTATAYVGTVHFTTSDASHTLPGDYTFVAGDNGVHTFAATLNTLGPQTIVATDTVTASITGTSAAINVSNATHYSVVAPASATAGTPFSYTVTALTGGATTATTYRGTVHFTSTDGAATLPANYTFVAGDNGVHTFSATLKTTGNQTITATDTVTPSITGTSNLVNVVAVHFVVTAPSGATAGSSFTFTVTALNFDGTTDTNYTGTVHLTSSDPLASLSADATLTSGVGTFTGTLTTTGAQTITATDTVTSSITGNTTVTVAAAAATVTPAAAAPVAAAPAAAAAAAAPLEPRFTG